MALAEAEHLTYNPLSPTGNAAQVLLGWRAVIELDFGVQDNVKIMQRSGLLRRRITTICRARVCPYGNSMFMCRQKKKKKRREGPAVGVGVGGGGGESGCAGGERGGGGGCKTNDIVVAESIDVNRDQTNGNDLLAAHSRHTVDAGFPSGFHLPGYSVSPIMHLQPQNSSLRTSLDSLYLCFLSHKIQYNFILLGVSIVIAGGMFCGTRNTYHTLTPIIKQ